MNQFEEFRNYYLMKSKEEENNMYEEEEIEEEFFDEKEDEINCDKDKNYDMKSKLKEIDSKRINYLPKRYHTYNLEFKKKIIEEVIQIYN